MNGNKVLHGHRVFLNIEDARSSKIDYAIPFERPYHFAYAVKFRTRTVVHQIAELDIIIRPSVIGIYNRQSIESV